MPYRLFYISASQVDACGDELRDILDVGTVRNSRLGVTGLLCFSGAHFCQILEGSPQALDELMASIRSDERHRMLVEWPAERSEDARWFVGWSLAYLFDHRLEALLGRLLEGQPARLADVTSEMMRNVDLFRSTQA